MAKPRVFVAVPIPRSEIGITTAAAIIDLMSRARGDGYEFSFGSFNGSDIGALRNIIASAIWADSSYSHLLFVDSDTSFSPDAVAKMVAAEAGVIGCVYAQRKFNIAGLMKAAREHPDDRTALAASLKFAVKPFDSALDVRGGIAKVAAVGMGLCLIARNALAALVATGQLTEHKDDQHQTLNRPIYGFFDRLPSLSEDYSFCERWRVLCGGDVFAVVDCAIGHTDDIEIKAAYLDQFKKL